MLTLRSVLDMLSKKADHSVLRLLQISQQHIESQLERVRHERELWKEVRGRAGAACEGPASGGSDLNARASIDCAWSSLEAFHVTFSLSFAAPSHRSFSPIARAQARAHQCSTQETQA